ncbi:MAG: mucoidy inhibitor MuiA family protein [Myxococcales bacterium]|nr:mucoidy inhibitor MuiA family protein [Myxococcales bacterium]
MSSLPSTLKSVTIYREGALCTRVAAIPAGKERSLRLGGLPLSLEPGSLRAKVLKGDSLRVQDVRPQFDVELAEEVNVPQEQQALEAAEETLERLRIRHDRVDTEISELENLKPRFLEPKRGEPPRDAPVEAMLALGDFSEARLAARIEERRSLDRQLEDAQRELELRQRRLHEASTARRTERARLTRVAVVTLSGSVEAPIELALEYLVPGARWVPNYALRLEKGMAGGTLQLRASVAQATGEDWSQISLALSTASLSRRADLPELRALKIGRRQEPPPRSGWREPPPGLDELFEAYDNALSGLPQPPLARTAAAEPMRLKPAPRAEKAVNKDGRRQAAPARSGAGGFVGGGGAVPGGPPPPPPPAPMVMPAAPMAPMAKSVAAPVLEKRARYQVRDDAEDKTSGLELAEEAAAPMESEGGYGEDVNGLANQLRVPEPVPAAGLEGALLDYSRLVMLGVSGGNRGRLSPGSPWDFAFVAGISIQVDVVMAAVSRAILSASSVRGLPLPANCHDAQPIDSFDYRYDCAAPVDVPSTGRWTTVPVMACNVGLAPEYVCVPSVEPKVYRTLQVANRSAHALPAGPVDVTQGDEFLLTTALPPIPPGADSTHRLGLGVEEAIKVARKTQYKETTGGFLGGSTVLPHDIEIELNNRLGSEALIEVRERLPYAGGDEKDLKVEDGESTPKWEAVDKPVDGQVVRGARRWRVKVPPGQSLKLTAQFIIRMPGDKMLVGGNRRA